MFDIECADVESTAVILSCAIIEFKLDEKPVYADLLNRSMFVKFDAAYQIKNLKRTVDKPTMEWWAKQSKIVKAKSLVPGIYDMEAKMGIDIVRSYAGLDVDSSKNGDVTFWARGALDQLCFDSLSKAAGDDILIPYSNWRDVRTAVDILCEGASRGYVNVPGFNRGIVHKHDPVHDCAYDVMMLLSNNLKEAA
jgi:hypothetical protein